MNKLIKRKNLEAYIRSNMSALEHCLETNLQEYFSLKDQQHDFGGKLDRNNILGLSERVYAETRDFLNITSVPEVKTFVPSKAKDIPYYLLLGPAIGGYPMTFYAASIFGERHGFPIGGFWATVMYASIASISFGVYLYHTLSNEISHYSLFNNINIAEPNTADATGTMAHEYAHHIQRSILHLPRFKARALKEGHARGVQMAVSRRFAEATGNKACMLNPLWEICAELQYAYKKGCCWNKREADEALALADIGSYQTEMSEDISHEYGIGTAAMQIAEAKHGQDVYRKVIQNDFSFLAA